MKTKQSIHNAVNFRLSDTVHSLSFFFYFIFVIVQQQTETDSNNYSDYIHKLPKKFLIDPDIENVNWVTE